MLCTIVTVRGGLSGLAPRVSRWLGRHPGVFPADGCTSDSKKDAIQRLNLTSLLTEKEMLESVVPDVHLVATLMSLSRVIPEKNKAIAREVVRKVVDELMKSFTSPMQQAVTGALNRSSRRRNPRYNEIDWKTTIEKTYGTISRNTRQLSRRFVSVSAGNAGR